MAGQASATCTYVFDVFCTSKGLTIATFIVGVACIFVRPLRMYFCKHTPCWRRDKAATDFFNGLSLVPFVAMPVSIIDSGLMSAVQSNELVLASAGVVGLIFVISEIVNIERPPTKRMRTSRASSPESIKSPAKGKVVRQPQIPQAQQTEANPLTIEEN